MWVHSTAQGAARPDRPRRAHRARHRRARRAQSPSRRAPPLGSRPRSKRRRRRAAPHQHPPLIRYQISEHLHQGPARNAGTRQKPGPRKYQKPLRALLPNRPRRPHRQAAADGCFPLISNDNHLTETELLVAYRYQPNLEKRHHQLKSVHDAAPVSSRPRPDRSAVRLPVHRAALLLPDRTRTPRRDDPPADHRPTPLPRRTLLPHPTATRTLELFNELTHHRLYNHERHIADFPPQLTPLQTQLLQMLGVPQTHYTG